MSPEANATATVYFGEASTSPQAREFAETLAPGHCEQTHASDEAYWEDVNGAPPGRTALTRIWQRRASTTTSGSRPGPRFEAAEP